MLRRALIVFAQRSSVQATLLLVAPSAGRDYTVGQTRTWALNVTLTGAGRVTVRLAMPLEQAAPATSATATPPAEPLVTPALGEWGGGAARLTLSHVRYTQEDVSPPSASLTLAFDARFYYPVALCV